MPYQSIREIKTALTQKTISSQEITEHYLARIEQYDPQLNSFISLTRTQALAQAKAADERLAKGEQSPLLGVPIAHKDIFCAQGSKTSCGSKMLDNFIAPYDATVIRQFNQAGSVMLGKTNMDEFAMGSSNENSYYGPVKNPWDTSRVPGGSSGGSASAVAARLCPAATGTDTGGSIRQPAALCGITGLKPTYGRVSRFGMIAFASSLDQGGPMAPSAEDVAYLMNVMAGFDANDSTSVDKPVEDYTANLNQPIKGLKIGLPKEYFTADLDKNIATLIDNAVSELQKLGAEIKSISLPNTHLSTAVYYMIAPAEASSNLARYDGVRFGYRCENPKDLQDLYLRSRGEGFGEEVKRRIMVGTYALSSGYYDAYYIQAQKIRQLISQDFAHALQDVDVILGPTTPSIAFKLGEKTADPISMYLSDIYTIAANLAGLPGLSLPIGFQDKMPVGMQLIGNYFAESQLLNVAHQYQMNTDWHTQMPEAFQP
jgi:aspartyl-tRNA(Asn)/glutamyl-tRNA(Gln) amidotransferase subunit A